MRVATTSMAPAVSTQAGSDAAMNGSNGETTTHTTQASKRSRSWKNKLQQHVNSWKRQSSNEKYAKSASSSATVNSTTPRAHILSRHMNGPNNAVPSPNQVPTLQSDSLVSLTSASLFSRNSYPSLFSNSTDATSLSCASTTCGITCPVDSQFVRPYKRMKNNLIVYLANDDVELPLDVVEQWETVDLDRLKTDLSEVAMEIYRKGVDRESKRPRNTFYLPSGAHEYDISFELRMSGRATRDAQNVAIGPCIWLVCGSTWACKDVRAAMEAITWPTLPLEIHEGRVPIPSVAEGQVDLDKLDLTDGFHLGDGIMLYIHIEDPSTESTLCGLLCCSTIKDGDTYSHHFSRIGGLVTGTNTLASSQFGVSTAHGMLDHPWFHRQLMKRSPATAWDCQSPESMDDEDEDDLESLQDGRESLYAERQGPRITQSPHAPSFLLDEKDLGEGYRNPRLVSRWRNVTHHGVLSFLGASMATENNLQQLVQLHDDTTSPTDHAMLRLGWPQGTGSRPLANSYRPRGATSERSIDITTHMSSDKLTEGTVSILCGLDSTLDAHLLLGSTCLTMGGRIFKLRKLKTTAPLARGVSGSWIVRGRELCGMVIAVSNPEPYIYMMKADDLISNLGASSPSIEAIDVFNSHSRQVKNEADGLLKRRWSSRSSQPRLTTAITTPRISVDKSRLSPSIRAGLTTKFESLIGSSQTHDERLLSAYQKTGTQPRRTRSMHGRLSGIFSTKIKEIIQPADQQGSHIKRVPEVQREDHAGNRRNSAFFAQATKHSKPKKKRRLPALLEPISETMSIVTLDADNVPKPEYAFLQSTSYTSTTPFRHGPIRMQKLDLVPGREPDIEEDPDCPEYKAALSTAAHHWLFENYESQQEQKVDEIGDLIDWWESWGLEDSGGLTMEETEKPLSPISTTSQDFPGTSYSDTTYEDSVGSGHTWSGHTASTSEQGSLPDYPSEHELQDFERASTDALYPDGDSKPNHATVSELVGGKNLKGGLTELYGASCGQYIVV
ncbi:hypothetical protein HD806DRAFT_31337 [Xylariaceae sp. AK1471]|nr:hypothetical protein HD806DRAFT_31337 [Xylariaceae sp. AK1471]